MSLKIVKLRPEGDPATGLQPCQFVDPINVDGDPPKETGHTFFTNAAGTWKTGRRVIARIEHAAKGANPRYIVTNLEGVGQRLYEKLYCARGDMENRIKEQQLDLFADRTSCHK